MPNTMTLMFMSVAATQDNSLKLMGPADPSLGHARYPWYMFNPYSASVYPAIWGVEGGEAVRARGCCVRVWSIVREGEVPCKKKYSPNPPSPTNALGEW